MTTPTIIGAAADATNAGLGYQKTLTLPAGTQAGDLMIVAEGAAGAYNTWNMPAGPTWTTVWAGHSEGSEYVNIGGHPFGFFLKWAFVPASPPADYTFENANHGSGNQYNAMGLLVIRGVHPVTPLRAVAYSNRSMDNNELGTTPTLTAVADDLLLSVWGWLAAYEVFSIDVADLPIDARNTAGPYLVIGDEVAAGGTTTARHMTATANFSHFGWHSGQIAIAPGDGSAAVNPSHVAGVGSVQTPAKVEAPTPSVVAGAGAVYTPSTGPVRPAAISGTGTVPGPTVIVPDLPPVAPATQRLRLGRAIPINSDG